VLLLLFLLISKLEEAEDKEEKEEKYIIYIEEITNNNQAYGVECCYDCSCRIAECNRYHWFCAQPSIWQVTTSNASITTSGK
jgi:hypothetical protein